MPSTASTTLTIDQIDLSPLNVRTYRPDAEDVGELERSILSEGLLNPIAVHPMKGRKGRWGAIAGGRRRRAILNLVTRGALPRDFPVRVSHHDDLPDAELILLSLAENEPRRPLREHERAAGVARCAARGLSLDAIAAGLGRDDPADIARLLRLGRLAPPVFTALQQGRISIEQAKAYGATDDTRLQAAAFAAIEAEEFANNKSADAIRRWMKIGDRELGRLLAFVGEEAYRAAGGGFELDLFADSVVDRGRIADEPLLRTLAEDRLKVVRDDARVACQNRTLRFVAELPQNGYGGIDYTLEIRGEPAELPEGDVVGHIAIDDDGVPKVTYWWASAKAKYGPRPDASLVRAATADKARLDAKSPKLVGAAIASHSYEHYSQQANAAVREEAGISAETTEALRSLRRTIMRAALVDAARAGSDIGTDFLVWSQLRGLMKNEPGALAGAVHFSPAPGPITSVDFAKGTNARAAWEKASFELTHASFIALDDPPTAFLAFVNAPIALKRLAAAYVAGLALTRSLNAPLLTLPIHDALAQLLDLDDAETFRRYWTPTSDLLDAIPTRQRLDLAEPFVERAAFAGWSRLKSADLTERVLEVVTGTGAWLRDRTREAAVRWVHPLLAFGRPAEAATLQEGAE